jgi:hypothetical protein
VAQNAAQSPPPSASLMELLQTVQQKTADWEKLAQSLDTSILALLPCDPKVTAAITAVRKASEARVSAMAAYLQEADRQAALQIASARSVLASVEPLGPDLAIEKVDLEQEQLGVNGQLAALTDSGNRRPSFTAAQDVLRQITALEQQRSDAVDSAASHAGEAAAAVRDTIAQMVAREAALKDAQAAFAAESIRWNAYYAARQARAQTECNVTKGMVAPARPAGKQTTGKRATGKQAPGTQPPGTPQ